MLPVAALSMQSHAATWGCGLCTTRRVACTLASAVPRCSQVMTTASHSRASARNGCNSGLLASTLASPAHFVQPHSIPG